MTTPETLRRDGESLGTFYHGRVSVLQNKKGYRFSVDAPLLADFIRTRAEDEALELGTGSGVISLLLSVKPFRRIVALEIQEGLADLARRNVELNGAGDRIEVVRADLRTYEPGRRFDLIFSNPPYIRKDTGFLSRSEERSAAKHELHGDIEDIMEKTAAWLEPDGRACFIYPEKRRADLARAADRRGLYFRRFRQVLPRAGGPANLFLAELGFAAGAGAAAAEPEAMRPLVLFAAVGKYTDEAEAVFSGP
ncbi:MAG: methyltransferase [Candidatus Aminicenantes bacterium]|nr:methyltransferase [Candidatus Aminicenantes bacterium]